MLKILLRKIQNIKISGIINDDILSHDLRSIQDEVYAHRSTSNPVPNCLHRFMRKNNEAIYDDYFEELENFTPIVNTGVILRVFISVSYQIFLQIVTEVLPVH
ncbi:S-4TM family putative pore-forming effector [Klebsiella pneumoniae]|uniref:S-4TM family putative pore-forming effector n=1 Tax=Klebsiella pneumoniae TaxID=573 RepID=UPI00202AB691|nr:S-4TM family putative pore-forming effector [Klebsiella pneumoniae]